MDNLELYRTQIFVLCHRKQSQQQRANNVTIAKKLLPCKSLPETLLFQLLGLSIATLSTVTHYGLRFTLISNVSLDSNAYKVIHHTAFYFGICLSMTLILAALLSSAATVRESQCLTAMVRIHTCRGLAGSGLLSPGAGP
uniref:Uncharacterized protein n=1 Tax=Serinus canaria TaxID=9135 RepID=A0A8C9U8C9_SERCA